MILMYARDVFPFLPNIGEDHPTKITELHLGNLSTITIHSMVGFVLFWFVRRYNLPLGRGILLFIVVIIKRPKFIFVKWYVVGCTWTNCFVVTQYGMCIIQLRLAMLVGNLPHRGQ
jgi:hypothetical protein